METIEVNRYECVAAQLRWTNEDGTPIDLSGRSLAVIEASPKALTQAVVTITDAANGEAELFISKELARALGVGRVNWLRLAMTLGDTCLDTTPHIWIQVV